LAIGLVLPLLLLHIFLKKLRTANRRKRIEALKSLGIPSVSVDNKQLVGFFHPYSTL